ncbi:zinc-dependent metalloprotease [Pontibacter cellulosilyticus]|uniref:Zinc-dependent metalloprotease n=1 Tax=Pontibacter cellulosilyticus TaxID=1720253 RepID=A0A923N2N2_9BACT|nr:zinc-dependent metalloprotease [Pontibacter cellulosilyticus]MBC5991288.1 zinc-dependent metalloprotease [Pontibacter cellulosilyticus]
MKSPLFKGLWLLLLVLSSSMAMAQKLPSIASKTEGMKRYPGYFTFYYDDASGKIWLEIDKLNQEFLYVNSLPAGLGSNDIGLDRGQLGSTKVVYFNRQGPKVMLVQPNLAYRATSNNPNERRAVEESFAQSILWGFKAEAAEGNKVLVDATDFLLRDAHDVVGSIKRSRQGNYKLDASRSALYLPRTKNFPKNTEFEATLTFTGGEDAGRYVREVAPDVNALTLRQHHSFIQLPDSNFQPRQMDPRAGYFGISYFDYSTPVDENIDKRFIARHRLQKKNPTAKVSEAVKPIIYYVDNGAPEPIRSALVEGARWWNQAYEAAGYKNAFQVEVLPDTADPMDVRYNIIQWVHRSTRGWSYGATVVDPRTGEIVKGHVSLGSLRVRQDYMIAEGLLAPYEDGKPASKEMMEMALARIRQLSAHEVGHTLGIMHNYAASSNENASVMDYPHPMVKLNRAGNIDLSKAYETGIGAWDKVAIMYGYQDFPKGTNEQKALNEILQQGAKEGLLFISDRDARAAGGAHPVAHLWDNGLNAAEELANVLRIREKALKNFSEENIKPGAAMSTLEDVLVPIYNFHRYQTEAASKLVGGLNYTYATRGDKQVVTEPVSKSDQQKALDGMLRTISSEVLTLPEDIIKLIPPRAPGLGNNRELFAKRTGLTFDPLAAAEASADFSLSLLLHPERASRLVELNARHSSLGLQDVTEQLIDKTWKARREKGLQEVVQMQTEQLVLTHLLQLAHNENTSYQARAIATAALQQIKDYANRKRNEGSSSPYQAHLAFALDRLNRPVTEEIKPSRSLDLPPGAPIGSGEVIGCE